MWSTAVGDLGKILECLPGGNIVLESSTAFPLRLGVSAAGRWDWVLGSPEHAGGCSLSCGGRGFGVCSEHGFCYTHKVSELVFLGRV